MRIPAFALLLALCTPAYATERANEPLSPRLAGLARAVDAGDEQALALFWTQIARDGTPLMEPLQGADGEMLVSFLWRASAGRSQSNVGVYGEFGSTGNAWPVNERLQRLGSTDVWYATHRMSQRACFSYQLTWSQGEQPTGEPAETQFAGVAIDRFVDALNPDHFANRSSIDRPPVRFSFATGPALASQSWLAPRGKVRHGKVETFELPSRHLNNTRHISIYTPPGAAQGCEDCDFLLLFDQAQYLLAVPTPTILDNMQADGALRPVVAAFVGNGPFPARVMELPPNEAFQSFVRDELMPWLRQRYSFSHDPRRAVVGGSSLGGLAAAYAALSNPTLFGNVLSQSGSYWWWPGFDPRSEEITWLNSDSGWLARQFSQTELLPVRFYMEVGSWEGTLMLLPNRTFRDVLQARGYEVDYREFAGGHDYGCWRLSLPRGLQSLLGK